MLIVSLTLVQDVAHSLCNEAETQMRIADRRIFLKKKKKKSKQNKKRTGSSSPEHTVSHGTKSCQVLLF